MDITKSVSAAAGITLFAGVAAAQHRSIGSVEMVTAPPATITIDAWESDVSMRLFYEGTFELQSDLEMDLGRDLRAGEVVLSYYLHFDPVNGSFTSLSGGIEFQGAEIVGVQAASAKLDASDALFGLDGVVYPTGSSPFRGAELSGAADNVWIEPDNTTLTIGSLAVAGGQDTLRVFVVEAIPAPGTASLAMIGLGLAARRRR